jgi:hypothetical protein
MPNDSNVHYVIRTVVKKIIIILKNDKTIIAYIENYLCNSQIIEAKM